MPRLKLTIEYSGRHFAGWQVQPKQRTIQGELERSFAVLLDAKHRAISSEKSSQVRVPSIVASGRTDAGVHAKAQVAHLDWPEILPCKPSEIKYSINGICSSDLLLREVSLVSPKFHARHSAHTKIYSYRMSLRDSRLVLEEENTLAIGRENIDISKMILEARKLQGTYDFSSFRSSDCAAKTTLRTVVISSLVKVDAETLVYFVQGKGFLKQMVRIIVGTLLDIGRGKANSVEEILLAKDRTLAGDTAPALALTLDRVIYD